MARVKQTAHPRGISRTTIRSNYPHKKVTVKVNRRTRVRIRKV